MTLSYKFNKDDPNATQGEGVTRHRVKDAAYYSEAGPVRNVCFVPLDGTRLFLNYSYLIAGVFSHEISTVTLTFTTHVITLKGFNLAALFDGLSTHSFRHIAAVDERYAAADEAQSIVTEIVVQSL